jgi:hypothetical protein
MAALEHQAAAALARATTASVELLAAAAAQGVLARAEDRRN